jgi:6-phosphogluconolactonase (cycloisomerase 2 family)
MSLSRRALALAATFVAALIGVSVAPATAGAASPNAAVYVLSNQPSGNQVLVYQRAADGHLTSTGAVDAGGNGTGGGLGSQGAIVVDATSRFVYAVNPASNSIASFRIGREGLERVDVVASGGTLPTSITVHGGLVYVLNAGGAGSINGFTTRDGDLTPIAGSSRPLSGAGTAPAQVSFTPDGNQLVVTERATQRIDLYAIDRHGRAAGPTVVASAGATPFGFGFDNKSHLVVSEAFGGAPDASAVSSYVVGSATLTTVTASAPTTETAACWIAVTGSGRFAYAGNAGGSISGYAVRPDGGLTLLEADGRSAAPGTGALDLALSRNDQFLYARLGNGSIGAWTVAADGSLNDLGPTTGLPAGAAGIAAA